MKKSDLKNIKVEGVFKIRKDLSDLYTGYVFWGWTCVRYFRIPMKKRQIQELISWELEYQKTQHFWGELGYQIMDQDGNIVEERWEEILR